MKDTRNLLMRLFVLLFAAAAVTGALAQGPRGAGGPGGPGGGPAPLALLLLDTQVHAALGLTTAQEQLWTALQTAGQSLRTQQATARDTLQALVSTQFAGGTPDLLAIEGAVAAQRQAQDDATEAVSAQAVAFYKALNTGQQAIVVAAAVARYQAAPQR